MQATQIQVGTKSLALVANIILMQKCTSGTVKSGKGCKMGLDKKFKSYEYNGMIIYKIHATGYCVYDEKIKKIIIIDNTLKGIKQTIDKWLEAKEKQKCNKKNGKI